MRASRVMAAFFVCGLATTIHAQCAKDQDHRSNTNSGIFVADFTISGTTALTSSELAGITGQLAGSCFDENSEELEARVRMLFQDQGFFNAEIKSLHIKANDPIGKPKPVSLEAEVAEGSKCRLGEIKLVGNHAFSTAQLRAQFSLSNGDVFERTKIAAGLQGLRKVYASAGFLDCTIIPDTMPQSDATIVLSLHIEEGTQYRMGKLEILAPNELSDRLHTEWQLSEGSIYDFTYVDQYLEANRTLLPSGFSREGVRVVRDCPEGLVEVRLLVSEKDEASRTAPKDVECDQSKKSK